MSNDRQQQLHDYLRREYSYLGERGLEALLRLPLQRKLAAKAEIEQAKVKGLYRFYVTGSLAPPVSPETRGGKRAFVARYSSYEAGLRARLLPHNVYFIEDAAAVRQVLGLPTAGIEPVPPGRIPKTRWWWLEQAPLDVGLLSNAWEAIHAAKARNTAYTGPELPRFIPHFLRAYLGGKDAVLRPSLAPEWLKGKPEFLWGRPPRYQDDLPLHRFVAVLLDRYGLPPGLFWRVRRYLFSHDAGDLGPRVPDPPPKKLDVPVLLPSVEFIPQRTPGGVTVHTLTITVQGIDAFTTPDDWKSIWKDYIAPVQQTWRQRVAQEKFKESTGRYPTLEEYQVLEARLKPPTKRPFTFPVTYLPVWERMKRDSLPVDRALHDLEREDKQFDRRNARRGVKRLEELMQPRP